MIVILGDLHFGIRGDSRLFLSYQEKIINNVIIPYLDKNRENIEKIVILGDIFDKRRQVNIFVLNAVKEFFDKLETYGIPIFITIGNHDTFFKNTNDINSPTLILSKYTNIKIIDNIPYEEDDCLFVPWVSSDNVLSCIDSIKYSDAKYVFGHFEINNAKLLNNQYCDFGLDPKLFEKFERVFSGHFHYRQSFENIEYTGCLWELSRDDMTQDKGFFVLDPKNGKYEFIPTQYKIFKTITYNEKYTKIPSEDEKPYYEGSFLKIIIENNSNKSLWNKFVEQIESFSPAEIVYSDIQSLEESSDSLIYNIQSDDFMSILQEYLSDITSSEKEKSDIFIVCKDIYNEALNNETVDLEGI